MISAVILAHNDQDTIKHAIESVSWCSEVIVVDDESSDATVRIAKKYSATVYTHPLSNDFAAQRNFGLSKTKGPARNASQREAGGEWVLFLDSDEIVSDALKKEIQEVTTAEHSVNGYFMKRTDSLWGGQLRYGETSGVRLLRLAKKGSGVWERAVHEVWNIHGPTETLESPLLHFPHPTVRQFISDVNWYSTINANMLFASKVAAPGWHVVAYPAAKFFRNYVWHLGFLDGVQGLFVAVFMSLHSFLTRGKLYMLYHKKRVPLP